MRYGAPVFGRVSGHMASEHPDHIAIKNGVPMPIKRYILEHELAFSFLHDGYKHAETDQNELEAHWVASYGIRIDSGDWPAGPQAHHKGLPYGRAGILPV